MPIKIFHSSANYIQNMKITSSFCKKLLMIKSVNFFFIPSIKHNSMFSILSAIPKMKQKKKKKKKTSLSVMSSVLAFCPSVALKKRSYKRLAKAWNLSQIVEIRFFRKFQGTKNLGRNHYSSGVLSKMAISTKMSVRDANISTSLMKTRAWFEIPGVWWGSILMWLKSVIKNIRRVQTL